MIEIGIAVAVVVALLIAMARRRRSAGDVSVCSLCGDTVRGEARANWHVSEIHGTSPIGV